MSSHRAEPLFLVPTLQAYAWKETNLNRDVVAEVQTLAKPDNQQKLADLISREPLSVAVAVTDVGAADPNDPHAFMKQQQGQQPRAVIFGDATWLSNARMGEEGLFDLFTGSVSWLRERPIITKAGTESKTRKGYALRPENPGEFLATVLFVPLTLLVVGIIGLGAGVWVVRRR
jgi:hypothetical protein